MFVNFHTFKQIGIRHRGRPVGFPHPPATVQSTICSVKLVLSLSKVDSFRALCFGSPSITESTVCLKMYFDFINKIGNACITLHCTAFA